MIKEVADCTFYEINEDGTHGKPVLYLDTLKVSTIEQTAENVTAKGGKGNPDLVAWDFGKEITLTIEDALFSPKSMSIMLGDGQVVANSGEKIARTVVLNVDSSTGKLPAYFIADIYNPAKKVTERTKVYMDQTSQSHTDGISFPDYSAYIKLGETGYCGVYGEDGTELDSDGFADATTYAAASFAAFKGKKVFMKYCQLADTRTITVSGDSFPGTYYVTGDTYSRSATTGKDQFFQFIVPKAKMQAENTITLEAEGDPSTFNMSLKVMRPDDGVMMRLVQYDLQGPAISG